MPRTDSSSQAARTLGVRTSASWIGMSRRASRSTSFADGGIGGRGGGRPPHTAGRPPLTAPPLPVASPPPPPLARAPTGPPPAQYTPPAGAVEHRGGGDATPPP